VRARRLVLTIDRPQGPIRKARSTSKLTPVGDQTILTDKFEAKAVGRWKILGPYIRRFVAKQSQTVASNMARLFPAVEGSR
jgi:hypothetical protein